MKEIILASGNVCLVDDADYESVSKYVWYEYRVPRIHTSYAQGYINGRVVKMHRFILGLGNSKILVDHKDRNGLNNTRDNLRRCNNSDNQKNKKVYGKSQYRGVSKHYNGKWIARINISGTQKHLGLFQNEIDAARAYDKAATESGNKFFILNNA